MPRMPDTDIAMSSITGTTQTGCSPPKPALISQISTAQPTYAPIMNSSPWAKLIISRMP